jgi:hypothetical protein
LVKPLSAGLSKALAGWAPHQLPDGQQAAGAHEGARRARLRQPRRHARRLLGDDLLGLLLGADEQDGAAVGDRLADVLVRLLTNFQTVSKRLARMKELEELDFDNPADSGFTKK